MDRREIQNDDSLQSIEEKLQEILRRLKYLDNVQIPFIYEKIRHLENIARTQTIDDPSQDMAQVREIRRDTIPIARMMKPPDDADVRKPLHFPIESSHPEQKNKTEISEIVETKDESGGEIDLHPKQETLRAGIRPIVDGWQHLKDAREHHEYLCGKEESPTNQKREQRDSEERTLRLELDIGGKWALRFGLFFIVLGFFIWGYFIKTLEPWEKAALFFVCGISLLVLGEYIYIEHKKVFQHYLSRYGVWLVIGGIEIMYIGAWRTYSVYHLTNFQYFVFLVLAIMIGNVCLSIRHDHILMNLQYLTTFSLVCGAVFIEYSPSDPYFTLLFLFGVTGILATDVRWRSSDHAVLSIGYSSIVLFILLGRTEGVTAYLVTGYLTILMSVSFNFRKVDTLIGLGKVPDLFWGSMLVLSYLHSLHFLQIGGEGFEFASLFGYLSLGMLCIYYLPQIHHGGKEYHFTTDLEFYFITGMFFFTFFTISPNWMLLPTLLVTGCVIAGFNLAWRNAGGDGIPQLMDSNEYFLLGPRKQTLFLLKNRTRSHLFLVCISLAAIIGLVWMDVSRVVSVAYIIGFLSMTVIFGTITYLRSDEDALMEMRTPIYSFDCGSIDRFELTPNSHGMDRSLNLHLPGTAVVFSVVSLSLMMDFSVVPLIPFIVFMLVVLLLNMRYAKGLKQWVMNYGLAECDSIDTVRDLLKRKWSGSDDLTSLPKVLMFMGVVTALMGIMVQGKAPAFLFLFIALVIILTKEGRFNRNVSFVMDKIGDDEDFPGLIDRSHGYILFIPLIPLILIRSLESGYGGAYGVYGYLLIILMIERWLFPSSSKSLAFHVLTVIILGLQTSTEEFSGFVFLLAAGLIMFIDRKWIIEDRNLHYSVPLLFLYTARGITILQDLSVSDVVGHSEMPPSLPLALEVLILGYFVAKCVEIALENRTWSRPDPANVHSIHPELMVLFALLPISFPQFHMNFMLIPLVILFLGLKLNAVIETFMSYIILVIAFWHLMSRMVEGIELGYFLIAFVGALLTIAILLDYLGRDNDASMGVFGYSSLALLLSSSIVFSVDVRTTVIWALMALFIITCGILLEKRYMRYTGIGVAGLTVLKILTYDLIEAPVWTRVVSLIFTGFCLLCIAYLYLWYKEKVETEKGTFR